MEQLNAWSDLPGLVIDRVDWEPGASVARILCEAHVLAVESSDPGLAMDLAPTDLPTLAEVRIDRVVVPYLAPGHPGDAAVLLQLADGQVLRLASEDPRVPVRIT